MTSPWVCQNTASSIFILITFSLLCIWVAITVIFLTIKFIVNYKKQKLSALSFYTGLAFCIITSIDLFATSVGYPTLLCDPTVQNTLTITATVFQKVTYGLHNYLFWLLLFIELHHTFKDTMYKLKSPTVKCWIILFVVFGVLYIMQWIVYAMDRIKNGRRNVSFKLNIQTVLIALGSLAVFLSMLIFPISLSVGFMKRLSFAIDSIKNKSVSTDQTFLSLITKMTILTVTSAIFTVIVLCFLILRESRFKLLLRGFVYLLDVYTNFVCFMLTQQLFDKYYKILCGPLHNKCQRCCGYYITNDESNTLSNYIEKNKSEIKTNSRARVLSVASKSKSSKSSKPKEVSVTSTNTNCNNNGTDLVFDVEMTKNIQ
eukprot:359678_1